MQHATASSSSPTGELISTFGYGKALQRFALSLAVVMIGLAGFLVYLETLLPAAKRAERASLPMGAALNLSQTQTLFYGTSALLAVIAIAMLGVYVWQKKLRQARYEVYERGIAHIEGGQKRFVPFAEIEDLYLFGSGQTAMTGLITNLAFRRNSGEPFHRVIGALKGFNDFQALVRELQVRERLPAVVNTLQSGGAVTFNYLSTGQVWSKRVSGDFLQVTTQPILLSRTVLDVQGQSIPMSSLRTVDLNAWTENVVIRDDQGNEILSTLATGIMSHDLFLNTLHTLLQAENTHQHAGDALPA